MDEYISDYIDTLINSPNIETEEVEETLRLYIKDEEMIAELLKVHQGTRENVRDCRPFVYISLAKREDINDDNDEKKSGGFYDSNVKSAIIKKFDLESQREPTTHLLLPRYLVGESQGKKKPRMIRYINDQVVTTTGQKYVEEK